MDYLSMKGVRCRKRPCARLKQAEARLPGLLAQREAVARSARVCSPQAGSVKANAQWLND